MYLLIVACISTSLQMENVCASFLLHIKIVDMNLAGLIYILSFHYGTNLVYVPNLKFIPILDYSILRLLAGILVLLDTSDGSGGRLLSGKLHPGQRLTIPLVRMYVLVCHRLISPQNAPCD